MVSKCDKMLYNSLLWKKRAKPFSFLVPNLYQSIYSRFKFLDGWVGQRAGLYAAAFCWLQHRRLHVKLRYKLCHSWLINNSSSSRRDKHASNGALAWLTSSQRNGETAPNFWISFLFSVWTSRSQFHTSHTYILKLYFEITNSKDKDWQLDHITWWNFYFFFPCVDEIYFYVIVGLISV